MFKNAAAIGLRQLLDHTHNTSSDLTCRCVDLFHKICAFGNYCFSIRTERHYFGSTFIEPFISRDVFVVADPLCLRENFNCHDISIQGPVLMLKRLYQKVLLKPRDTHRSFFKR